MVETDTHHPPPPGEVVEPSSLSNTSHSYHSLPVHQAWECPPLMPTALFLLLVYWPKKLDRVILIVYVYAVRVLTRAMMDLGLPVLSLLILILMIDLEFLTL
jgi:hypothetical protein